MWGVKSGCHVNPYSADLTISTRRNWHRWNLLQHRGSVSVSAAEQGIHQRHQFTQSSSRLRSSSSQTGWVCLSAAVAAASSSSSFPTCLWSSLLCSSSDREPHASISGIRFLLVYQLQNCLLLLCLRAMRKHSGLLFMFWEVLPLLSWLVGLKNEELIIRTPGRANYPNSKFFSDGVIWQILSIKRSGDFWAVLHCRYWWHTIDLVAWNI